MKFTVQFQSPVVVRRAIDEQPVRFRVVLITRTDRKIPAIKALREATGFSLKYAKELICDATLPTLATAALTEEEARALVFSLGDAGVVARCERADT